MTVPQRGLFVQPGQGPSVSVVGDVVTFKAVGEDTGGKYALFEMRIEPQAGTPPHIHNLEDEAFYIQEGEIEFQLDDRTFVATAGTFLHSPKGQLHCFKNVSPTSARMLCLTTPAGIEKFFAEVGTEVKDLQAPVPPIDAAVIERIIAIAPKYGIDIVTPDSSPT